MSGALLLRPEGYEVVSIDHAGGKFPMYLEWRWDKDSKILQIFVALKGGTRDKWKIEIHNIQVTTVSILQGAARAIFVAHNIPYDEHQEFEDRIAEQGFTEP